MSSEVCTLCGGWVEACACGPPAPRPEPRDDVEAAIRASREPDPVAMIHAMNRARLGRTVGEPAPSAEHLERADNAYDEVMDRGFSKREWMALIAAEFEAVAAEAVLELSEDVIRAAGCTPGDWPSDKPVEAVEYALKDVAAEARARAFEEAARLAEAWGTSRECGGVDGEEYHSAHECGRCCTASEWESRHGDRDLPEAIRALANTKEESDERR